MPPAGHNLKVNKEKFDLFISWSGPVSEAVANALFSWLPEIMPFVKPWISSHNIPGGKQWNSQLESVLRTCHASIACITSDNIRSEWLHFEAGSVGLRTDKPLLVPYLFELIYEKLSYPLAQFQSRSATLESTLLMTEDILSHARMLGITKVTSVAKIARAKYPLLENHLQKIRDEFGPPIDAPFRVAGGTGVQFEKLIDNKTNEVIIAGQNLQGLIRNGILPFLEKLYDTNPSLKVVIILTKPEFFKVIASGIKERKNFELQFNNTLKSIDDFKTSLSPERSKRFIVLFNPGVSSLSAIFRDPSSKTRGLVAIIPKWATDIEPDNRLFFLIERATNDHLFHRIYGHIGIMNDLVHSETLQQVIEKQRLYELKSKEPRRAK